MTDIDAWIEREFSGHGRALRRIDETPLPDEPWMAMSDAKNIVRGVLKENERLRAAITLVRGIIVEASMTGFNCHDGDWAEQLFRSQQVTHEALNIQQPIGRRENETVQAGAQWNERRPPHVSTGAS